MSKNRETVERQKEHLIRQIAADTRQSAQLLRIMNKKRFNATPISLTDDRSDDLSDYALQALEYHQLERKEWNERDLTRCSRGFIEILGVIVI